MFEGVCKLFNLGELLSYTEIKGGITNKMYKVVTNKKAYAFKVLNTEKKDDLDALLKELETSEVISNIAFSNKVNSVRALKFNGTYIQKYEDKYILIYDFIPGIVKLTKDITLEDVRKVAYEQAKFHKINPNEYGFNEELPKYTFNDYEKYYNLLKDRNDEYLTFFKENYFDFVEKYKIIYDNYLKLDDKPSFVHRDLNRKNILWDNGIPYIIDFEEARVGYPSIDFFNSIWFLSNDIEEEKFTIYAGEYLKHMKINILNGVYAGIIEECNWLYFSLKRLFSDDPYQVKLGMESIEISLREILNYYDKIPLMLELFKNMI